MGKARAFVAPAYLFACLVLGGSAQGIWQNMLLQIAGLAIIAWSALDSGGEQIAPAARQLLLLVISFVAIVLLQTIPLPAEIWAHLRPRELVAEGFHVLRLTIPPEPLSLTPAAGLTSLFAIIPSLALLCAMVRLRAYRSHLLAMAIIAGTLAGILLGTLQVASSNPELSRWYLYEDTNPGKAVGFFANADHMASLLVVTIPFVAGIVATGRRANLQRYSATVAVAVAIAILVVVGLALNGSLAGYGLALPVIAASALIIIPRNSLLRPWVIGAAFLLMIGSVAALEMTPIGSGKIGSHATSAVQSRSEILSTTVKAARDFMPFGSGLGSFQRVYPLYEKPEQVTPIYVVHAHNDYMEVALELGAAGVILILAFLSWWFVAVWRVMSAPEKRPFAKAAAIASAAILIHSFVDFPLRTAAISACFSVCMALLGDAGAFSASAAEGQLRPTRHLVI